MEKEVPRTHPLLSPRPIESFGTTPLETEATSSTSYIYSSRDEQLEGGVTETEAKADTMSDEYSEEEFSDAKDVRVPVNGQVVNMPITSSVSVLPVSRPVEGVVSPSPVNMAMSRPSSDNLMVSLPSTSSSCPESVVRPVHKSLTSQLTSSCNSVKSAKNRTGESVAMPQLVSSPSFSDSAITLLSTVTSSANLKKSDSAREKVSEDGSKVKLPLQGSGEFPYTCPVCQEPFKSKRSFNAHIIVHCQLVNGSSSNGPKRSMSSAGSPSPDKKRIRENAYNEQLESGQHGSKSPVEDLSLPLDLSCRGGSTSVKEHVRPAASSTPENKDSPSGSDTESKAEQTPSASQEMASSSAPLNQSALSDRGPLEDENENLVNEARERENSFFNTAQNEQYLTEDSTGLDPPPPLPLYGSGGTIRRIRVSSDDGPPMVYSVRLHAEQVAVSRILGVNEETGDKMELYKCFMCSVAFPSISRLQAHLSQHKQRFVCSKCSFSSDSRVQFSHHVQREHLSSAAQSRSDGSLRHLIKRDRRKKGEDDSPTPSVSPVPLKYPESRFKDVLKETANKLITSSNIDMTGLSGQTNGLEITLTSILAKQRDEAKKVLPEPKSPPVTSTDAPKDQPSTEVTSSVTTTTYTTSLTRIIAASLDSSTRGPRRHPSFLDAFRNDELEPGEIRLDRRSKIVDGESGRRLVITDDQSEEGLDHSPHFSNYAPRLNIVQEPIDRDKALIPITDDIGRTFFECPYCNKLFGSTSDMNRHLDFHEDLRPYNCEYCDYSARTNSQLKVHKMRHEGIKLYSCDVCNYNGVTQSDLNRHKKTQSHIARSQNVCSMCGLGFYTASQKQVHVVQCHPEVEGASSLIQMSLGPPVAPLMTGSEFSSLSNSGPSTAAPSLTHATATAQ